MCSLVKGVIMIHEESFSYACSIISKRPVNKCFHSLGKKTEKLHGASRTPPSDWASVEVALVGLLAFRMGQLLSSSPDVMR